MFTLAQLTGMQHFPSGPALDWWLFEQPIPTVLVLIASGIIGAYVLRQQGRGRDMKWALIGSVVLSAGVVLLASMVTTDRELLRRGTSGFVEAIISGDRAGARGLLDQDALLAAAGVEFESGGDEIAAYADLAEQNVDTYNLRTVSTSIDGKNTGRTRFDITLGSDGIPTTMGVELGWRRLGGAWLIVRAECVQINNRPATREVARYLRN